MEFNHINKKLTQEQVSELKSLYYAYHRHFWCYKKMFKKFKQSDLALKLTAVTLTTVGTIVGTITLNPIILASLTGTGVFLQTVITQKNFSKKTEACRHAYQCYKKLLNKLKLSLRTGEVDNFLERELSIIDDQVIDSCPPISENYKKLHAKQFSSK